MNETVPQNWDTFCLLTGGRLGALIGLLFVAISIHATTVAASADLRSRAAQTLTVFVSPLLIAIMISIPAQPDWLFGAELILLSVLLAALLLVLDRRARTGGSDGRLARTLEVITPNVVTAVGTAAAGILMLCQIDWGIYLLVPSAAVALVGGLAGAWLFLTALGD